MTLYEDFCQVVYHLYLRLEEERKWLVTDMDKLVRESSRIEILLLSNLGEFYYQFLMITSFLLSKDHIFITKQGCTNEHVSILCSKPSNFIAFTV